MSYDSTGDITLTLPKAISGIIRVYASGASGSATGTDSKIVLSDSSEITCNVLSSAPQYFSFGSKTNITSITLKQAQYGVRLAAVEVDGTILKDPLSPNGNASATNFNPFNTDINTVRGQETGYATLSPVRGYLQTLSNGNLTGQTAGGWVGSTVDVSSGKYYVEFIPTSNTIQMFGICSSEHTSNAYPWQTAASKDVTYYVADGRVYVDAVNTGTTSAAAVGDTISLS